MYGQPSDDSHMNPGALEIQYTQVTELPPKITPVSESIQMLSVYVNLHINLSNICLCPLRMRLESRSIAHQVRASFLANESTKRISLDPNHRLEFDLCWHLPVNKFIDPIHYQIAPYFYEPLRCPQFDSLNVVMQRNFPKLEGLIALGLLLPCIGTDMCYTLYMADLADKLKTAVVAMGMVTNLVASDASNHLGDVGLSDPSKSIPNASEEVLARNKVLEEEIARLSPGTNLFEPGAIPSLRQFIYHKDLQGHDITQQVIDQALDFRRQHPNFCWVTDLSPSALGSHNLKVLPMDNTKTTGDNETFGDHDIKEQDTIHLNQDAWNGLSRVNQGDALGHELRHTTQDKLAKDNPTSDLDDAVKIHGLFATQREQAYEKYSADPYAPGAADALNNCKKDQEWVAYMLNSRELEVRASILKQSAIRMYGPDAMSTIPSTIRILNGMGVMMDQGVINEICAELGEKPVEVYNVAPPVFNYDSHHGQYPNPVNSRMNIRQIFDLINDNKPALKDSSVPISKEQTELDKEQRTRYKEILRRVIITCPGIAYNDRAPTFDSVKFNNATLVVAKKAGLSDPGKDMNVAAIG